MSDASSGDLLLAVRTRLDAAPESTLLLSTLSLLLLMILIFAFTADQFFTLAVLRNVLTQTSIYIILGVGLTIVLTSGEIDISIGSIIGLGAMVLGISVVNMGFPIGIGLLATLLVGVLCGLMNGFLTAMVGVPSIIVTLGALTFFRGLAYLLGGGTAMVGFPPFLVWIGSGHCDRCSGAGLAGIDCGDLRTTVPEIHADRSTHYRRWWQCRSRSSCRNQHKVQ